MPFYPDDVKPITEEDSSDIDKKNDSPELDGSNRDSDTAYNDFNVDSRPIWFDPIFTEVFMDLKKV